MMKNRDFQVIDTDLFTYMVSSACYEYQLMHWIDYVVLTREKQPSINTRKHILNALTERVKMTEDEVKGMQKGKIFECWGEDRFL